MRQATSPAPKRSCPANPLRCLLSRLSPPLSGHHDPTPLFDRKDDAEAVRLVGPNQLDGDADASLGEEREKKEVDR